MSKSAVRVEAQSANSLSVRAGQLVKITDIEGHQVGDFFALDEASGNWLNVSQTRNFTDHLNPRPGDLLYDDAATPILRFEEDCSPGPHDTLYPPCDDEHYVSLGLHGHPNCKDNFLSAATAATGIRPSRVPDPFNLFQNSLPDPTDWSIDVYTALSEPGDYVTFKALTDVLIVLTACSVDNYATNNFVCTPLLLECSD